MQTARLNDAGKLPHEAGSMAKRNNVHMALEIAREARQIHGGMGVSWEVDIAHYFKRLTVIDQIFGNADWHLDKLAT